MEPMQLAVVGAGGIAQRNARESARSGAARIAGVFDVNRKAARDLAGSLGGARVFASYEEVLESRDVEAVLLSTPHDVHKSMTLLAADAGKHVLVEKPIATTVADAEEMIDRCRRAGVALTVNYSFRYLPRVQRARELVQGGALGDIAGVQVVSHQFKDPGYWMGGRSNSPDDWRSSRARCGGGFLIMNLCHTIDYLYYVTGLRGTRVYCEYETVASPGDVEDILSLSCRFGQHAVGSMSASSVMRGSEVAEERIWGTKGTLILAGGGLSLYSTRAVSGLKPGKLHRLTKFPDTSWTAEWVRRFVTDVREGREPEITGRVAWENLAFITSAYESMHARMPIEVPEYAPVSTAEGVA